MKVIIQATKVWWDGEKLMAESIEPQSMYKESQDDTCRMRLSAQGKPYPRTCKKCGLGPCFEKLDQENTIHWSKMMKGVRVEGDSVVISVKGGNKFARALCEALIQEMNR